MDETKVFDFEPFYKECRDAFLKIAREDVEQLKAAFADGVQFSDFVVISAVATETIKIVEHVATDKLKELGSAPSWAKKKSAERIIKEVASDLLKVQPDQIDGTVGDVIDAAVTLWNILHGHHWLQALGHTIGSVLKTIGKLLKQLG